MIKQTVAVLAVALGLAVYAEIPTRAYIQDCLIAHWDGIENAGAGKDRIEDQAWPDVKKWADLKQGVTIPLSGDGDGFSGNYFTLRNASRTSDAVITSENLSEATERRDTSTWAATKRAPRS